MRLLCAVIRIQVERKVKTVAKYRYSRNSSPFDEARQMYLIIGACALAVIIGLVLLLTLQNGCSEPEIPVVEQGDGLEELLPGLPSDSTITSMGDIIIDDGNAPVTEFEVTVSGSDGVYKRSGQDGDEAGLTISGQNSESFSFVLELPKASVDGVAYFNSATTAVCEKADGAIIFAFDADVINVTAEGAVSELNGANANGSYLLAEAATTTTATTTTATTTAATTAPPPSDGKFDLDSIKKDSVKSALSEIMPSDHYKLLNSLMEASGGYGLIYGTGKAEMEAKGRSFNHDAQMNAVMYYANEPGTGREVVIICADNGRQVYVGLCDGSEYRYYSNDPDRQSVSAAPHTITQYAKLRNMTLEG